jgi:SAM-dependent methyltransferase
LIDTACVTAENYIIRVMIFRWSTVFRPLPRIRQTALAMVDPRAGDAILFVGASDPALAGECGAVAGLNGRTVVAGDQAAAASRVETAAANAGALVEFITAPPDRLPFDAGTFGLIVVPDLERWPPDARLHRLTEVFRVAGPGARVILLVTHKRGLFSTTSPHAPSREDVLQLFTRIGAVAARQLADRDGVAYYEARKPRIT